MCLCHTEVDLSYCVEPQISMCFPWHILYVAVLLNTLMDINKVFILLAYFVGVQLVMGPQWTLSLPQLKVPVLVSVCS